MDHTARRRRWLLRSLREEGLDALLVSNPVNVTYLTGFSGDSSYLILGRQRTLLVSDARYTAQIEEECSGLEAHIRPVNQTVQRAAAEALDRLEFHSVGFESAHLTVANLETLSDLAPTIVWKGDTERVERLRVCKDASEIAQ